MQDGSRQMKQGINLATNSFTFEECIFLCNILKEKFNLKCTVVKSGFPNQCKISI
jgi:DNA-binding transcriptional regulator LsrR (DeoR family)